MALDFNSNNIKVFPSAYRTYNPGGKYTSEQNITNMIKALADKDSFVVDFINTSVTLPYRGILKVVVDGYYFEISDFELSGNQYLSIRVENGYLVDYSNATTTLDTGGIFTGLDHSTSSGMLQVCKDGKIINKGFIRELIDSEGNWIDLSNITIVNNKIDPKSINFDKFVYIANLLSQYATLLGTSENGAFKGYSVGTGGKKLIYFNNGMPEESTSTVGSATNPVYLNAGTITASNTTVGSSATNAIQPVFLSSGTITASSHTAGSASRPVYVDSGIIKPITQSITGSGAVKNFINLSSGTISKGNSVTISNRAPTSSDTGTHGDLWFVIGGQ